RIVTPGTVTDEALLEERRDNLLAALHDGERTGLSVLDIASGRFSVQEIEHQGELLAELARVQPVELLVSEAFSLPPAPEHTPGLRRRPPWHFDTATATRDLPQQFGTRDLAGFGAVNLNAAVAAAGAL